MEKERELREEKIQGGYATLSCVTCQYPHIDNHDIECDSYKNSWKSFHGDKLIWKYMQKRTGILVIKTTFIDKTKVVGITLPEISEA